MAETVEDLKWEQVEVIHCPLPECKGMLLQSPYLHENKCSNCGKLWILNTEWVEAKEKVSPEPPSKRKGDK